MKGKEEIRNFVNVVHLCRLRRTIFLKETGTTDKGCLERQPLSVISYLLATLTYGRSRSRSEKFERVRLFPHLLATLR